MMDAHCLTCVVLIGGDAGQEGTMLPEIKMLLTELEDLKSGLLSDLKSYPHEYLRFQPTPDRWSMLMALQHIVLAEQGIRLTQAELGHDPARRQMKRGNMFDAVMDVLEKDIPVEVPDPSLEPDGSKGLDELIALWDQERKAMGDLLKEVTGATVNDVMFSHPVTGPLDAIRTLKLAVAHFNTHRRQIDRLRNEIQEIGE